MNAAADWAGRNADVPVAVVLIGSSVVIAFMSPLAGVAAGGFGLAAYLAVAHTVGSVAYWRERASDLEYANRCLQRENASLREGDPTAVTVAIRPIPEPVRAAGAESLPPGPPTPSEIEERQP
ncbi:hypothetical protein [Thermomonospora umbrina]|uniref:hypothetical protein n=1 Tax=Thermomonospora umbrina TaxID=111806 RepID=UPI0011C198A8|nr:hypothetical protein [Thermomonospora umbrina]